jgi:mevalonyl-CoA ligase
MEIEERLVEHPSIAQAIVVGIGDPKYGEVVGAFLEQTLEGDNSRPTVEHLQEWVRKNLAWHKAPVHVFWFGDDGVGNTIPLTGSGKIKKQELKKLGDALLERQSS